MRTPNDDDRIVCRKKKLLLDFFLKTRNKKKQIKAACTERDKKAAALDTTNRLHTAVSSPSSIGERRCVPAPHPLTSGFERSMLARSSSSSPLPPPPPPPPPLFFLYKKKRQRQAGRHRRTAEGGTHTRQRHTNLEHDWVDVAIALGHPRQSGPALSGFLLVVGPQSQPAPNTASSSAVVKTLLHAVPVGNRHCQTPP